MEGFFTAIIDEWPRVLRPYKELFILGICTLSYFIGFFFVVQVIKVNLVLTNKSVFSYLLAGRNVLVSNI